MSVGPLARGVREALGDLTVVAAHVEEDRLRPFAQGRHIDARRHGKQDVAHANALSGPIGACMCGMVPAARVFRGFGQLQFPLQQRFDGAGGRFADHAVCRGRVGDVQQTCAQRLLAQQLGAGALA